MTAWRAWRHVTFSNAERARMTSRLLTPNELAAIDWILVARAPELPRLRAQTATLRALPDEVRVCDLTLATTGDPEGAAPDGPMRGPLVVDVSGDATGHIDLWVKAGLLSYLEYSWFVEMPTEYPSPDRLRPWPSSDIAER